MAHSAAPEVYKSVLPMSFCLSGSSLEETPVFRIRIFADAVAISGYSVDQYS